MLFFIKSDILWGMTSEYPVPAGETGIVPEFKPAYTPIGVIKFGEDRSFSLESNIKGTLKVSPGMTESCSDLGSGRVYDFGRFQEVTVVQVDLGSLFVGNHPSIRTSTQSLFAQIEATNPLSGDTKVYSLGEEKLLDVLTGKRGGLLTFYGDDQPEGVALVIEDKEEDENKALIIFFSSDPDISQGLDSISGVRAFFESASVALAGRSSSQSFSALRNVCDIYDEIVEKEKVSAEGGRREIVRTLLFAHAFAFDRTKGEEHAAFLDEFMPNWRSGRLRRRDPLPLSDPLVVNTALNTIMRGDALPTYENGDAAEGESGQDIERASVSFRAQELYRFFSGESLS